MKIVHVCLSCFYIDGYAYQENELVRAHVRQGHDVKVLASTASFDDEGRRNHTDPGVYMGTDGAEVTRLPYRGLLPQRLMEKLRAHPGVRTYLEREAPDVIVCHGISGWELLTVARHCRRNPHVILKADTHTDANNSASSALSRILLHKVFYRAIIALCRRQITPLLCISVATMDFAEENYGFRRDQLAFFPLGGDIPEDAAYQQSRAEMRAELGIAEDEILLVHSGKFIAPKKTAELIAAFQAAGGAPLRLVLAGRFVDGYCEDEQRLIAENPAMEFIGWQDRTEMVRLLAAADVYMQPGSQSATMQMSLCHGCAIVLDNVSSHTPYHDGNGWLLDQDTRLEDVLQSLAEDPGQVAGMGARSLAFARENLDYDALARRLLS
ncbi:MAG: glycosyltransferase family 4 protein [Pseudomonadota bacterium]